MSEEQPDIFEQEKERLQEEIEKRKKTAEEENKNLKFQTKYEVIGAFNDLMSYQSDVNDEDIKEFIRHKNAYLVANPEDLDEISGYIQSNLEFQISNNSNSNFTNKYTTALNNMLSANSLEDFVARYKENEENQELFSYESTPMTEDVITSEQRTFAEDIRIRSHDNFDNESAMYRIELGVLADMDLIPSDEAQDAINTYTKLLREHDLLYELSENEAKYFTSNVSAEDLAAGYELVTKGREKVSEKNSEKYKNRIADEVFKAATNAEQEENPWYNLLTPELTAIEIEKLASDLSDKSLSDDERQELETRYNRVLQHGDNLLSDLTQKQGYYFTDITNVADEYDGYMHLSDVCERAHQADETDNNDEPTVYDTARQLMDEYIEPYDELYNIPSGKNPKDTAINLNSRFNNASAIIDKLEFNEKTLGREYLQALQNYEFVTEYDYNGNAVKIEECITVNEDGEMEVVKGSSLETVLKFAANETMMQNLGNSAQKMNEELIIEGVRDNAFNTLFAYSNSEEVVKQGLREDPYKFTDQKENYIGEFEQKLMRGEKVQISPLGVKLALDRQANNVETFSNRLTSKLGAENTEYLKAGLLGQVKKIDETSRYNDGAKKVKNAAVKRGLIGAGLNFGVATAASYVATKLSLGAFLGMSKAAPVMGGMAVELGIGGGNALIGAVSGAAVSTISYLTFKKVNSLLKGQKYGWKDVKKDLKSPQFVSALTAGALGGASVGFALSGCAKCAMVCGVASMGAASIGRFYTQYRDMRLHGHGRVASTAMGIANAASVFAGVAIGHSLGSTDNHMEITADDKQAKDLYQNLDQAKKDGWNLETSEHSQDGFTLLNTTESEQWTAEATERARATLESFYGNNTDALNNDLNQVSQQLHALGRDDIPPEIFLRNSCDAGMNTGIDTINHVDGGGVVHTHGNNLVMTDLWSQQHDVDPNLVHALGGIKSSDGTITITQDALNGFEAVKEHVSVINEIGSTMNADGTRLSGHLDGFLNRNAMVDNTNTTVHAPEGQGTEFNTYANGDNGIRHHIDNLFGRFTKSIEAVSGFGAMIVDIPHKVKQFLRPGAKADQISELQNEQAQPDAKPNNRKNNWSPEIVIPAEVFNDSPNNEENSGSHIIIGGTEMSQEALGRKDLPNNEENSGSPVIVGLVDDIQKTSEIKELLADEYKIVYGIAPSDKSRTEYTGLVMEEFKADLAAGTTKAGGFAEYLKERKEKYDDMLAKMIKPSDKPKDIHQTKKGKEATADVRQAMFQTNLSSNSKELPHNKMTLQKFTQFASRELSKGSDKGGNGIKDGYVSQHNNREI
ncbi:MAG: hypothetical protein MJ212_01305 [Alphaproteobacteria bacterium]|nr:hypothetical protein [Alphaproteobacteria bacterium]